MQNLAEELMMIARTLPDNISKETCRTLDQSSQYIKTLESELNRKGPIEEIKELAPHAKIEMLEDEVKKLRKALEIYERERERFKHAYPEMTGAYFISGGHGNTDDNMLPQYVRIVPAYGCAFEVVYEKTDRTITYEGS